MNRMESIGGRLYISMDRETMETSASAFPFYFQTIARKDGSVLLRVVRGKEAFDAILEGVRQVEWDRLKKSLGPK